MSAIQVQEDIDAKCGEIEAYTERLKRSVRRVFTYDSKWLDEARAEALHIVDAACGILEIVGLEQGARLDEYDKQCGLIGGVNSVLFPEGRDGDEVDNE